MQLTSALNFAVQIDAMQRRPSLPGLTRQSIPSTKLLRRMMDARVKPGHDE
jgi:hypothetical protein